MFFDKVSIPGVLTVWKIAAVAKSANKEDAFWEQEVKQLGINQTHQGTTLFHVLEEY